MPRTAHGQHRATAFAQGHLALPQVRNRDSVAQRDMEQGVMKIRRSVLPTKSAQRGVVLFIALIVMVVMSLAAIALMRSVDTTTAVIGNIAFRQASILPGNFAIEDA